MTDDADKEEEGRERRRKEEEGGDEAQMGDSRLLVTVLGGSPPPVAAEEAPGRVSISSPVSSIGGMRASSSDSGTNSGWAMKLWMELRDSGLCSPSYRELRNAFTTLICKTKEKEASGDEKSGAARDTCDGGWEGRWMERMKVMSLRPGGAKTQNTTKASKTKKNKNHSTSTHKGQTNDAGGS